MIAGNHVFVPGVVREEGIISFTSRTPRTVLSAASFSALCAYQHASKHLHQWDTENPMPAFERAQEAHKVERLSESMKVAEAGERLLAELDRDARGR